MSLIQMPVDPRREVPVVFRFGLSRPWLRVIQDPMIPIQLPLLEEVRRYRISKTEGQKIRRLILLPASAAGDCGFCGFRRIRSGISERDKAMEWNP